MRPPTYVAFSLSVDAAEPLEVVKDRIEKALHCALKGGEYAGAGTWREPSAEENRTAGKFDLEEI